MNNEETVQKVIDIFDCIDLYEGGFVVDDLITDIAALVNKKKNPLIENILIELDDIKTSVSGLNYIEIGDRLSCLRNNLIRSYFPKVITNKNVVLGKVLEGLKEPSKRFELNMIIRETLAR